MNSYNVESERDGRAVVELLPAISSASLQHPDVNLEVNSSTLDQQTVQDGFGKFSESLRWSREIS